MEHRITYLSILTVGVLAFNPNTGFSQELNGFEISANTSLVSEYVFRGITQSDETIAIQGGFDVNHESGLYAGLWASSVDFNDGDEASVEVDFYAGYGGAIENVSYDVGGIYYAYPGADNSLDYDFWEIYGSVGYDFDVAAVSVGVNYSPDYFGGSGDALYSHLGVDVPLPYDLGLSAGVGYQTIDDNDAFGVPDYTDWNLSLGYSWDRFDVSVTYHDTDLDEPTECADGCDTRFVLSLTANF